MLLVTMLNVDVLYKHNLNQLHNFQLSAIWQFCFVKSSIDKLKVYEFWIINRFFRFYTLQLAFSFIWSRLILVSQLLWLISLFCCKFHFGLLILTAGESPIQYNFALQVFECWIVIPLPLSFESCWCQRSKSNW